MTTILTLKDPTTDAILEDGILDISTLAERVAEHTNPSVDIRGILPHVALTSDYGRDTITGFLLAVRSRLQAHDQVSHIEEGEIREVDLPAHPEVQALLAQKNVSRNTITKNDHAVIRYTVPTIVKDEIVAQLEQGIDTLIAFLKRGTEAGALLENSDFVQVQATPPESVQTAEEPVPAVEPVQELETETVVSEPTIVEGIPEEALPVEG